MNTIFHKIVTGVLAASLALTGVPLATASAAVPNDSPTPGAPLAQSGKRSGARLQRAFARETRIIKRIGKVYDRADEGFPRIEKLIEKAEENGLDVSEAQAAFDAFKSALATAEPFYEQAESLADAHNGFDADGKVTDAAAARETVKGIHDALAQAKDAMNGTMKALHEALRDLRQELPKPTSTSSSS